MHQVEFLAQIYLPTIPDRLISSVPLDYDLYQTHSSVLGFSRSDSFQQDISDWCRDNIIPNIHYGWQIIKKDIPANVDNNVKLKLFYLVRSGGNSVHTLFWNQDHSKVLVEYCIPCNQWFLFRADVPHSVVGIESEQSRLSLVAKLY